MYAVIGASGRVGGAVACELRRRGLPVRAIVRDAAKAQGLRAAGCEIAIADLHDAPAVRAALVGTTAVHAILPMNGVAADGLADADSMIAAMHEALAEVHPQHVVAVSDYGAYHATGIGLTQIWHRFEQRLSTLPIAVTLLRSAEHMESWTGALRDAAAAGTIPLLHQPLTKVVPTVSAPDVGIIAAAILADHSGTPGATRVVHVEGPRRYSVGEIVETIAHLVGHPVIPQELPPERWVPTLIARGLSDSYARLVAEMMAANNAGRMDVEPGRAEVMRGTTTLTEALSRISQKTARMAAGA